MPRLILIAGDIFLALREPDNEAIVRTMLCQPRGFRRIAKGIVNGVAVNGQSGLVLGISRTGRKAVRLFRTVYLTVIVVDLHLIGIVPIIGTNIQIQPLLCRRVT